MFRFNHHHQGAYYLSLLKLYLLKLSVKIHRCSWFGGVAVCSHTTELSAAEVSAADSLFCYFECIRC